MKLDGFELRLTNHVPPTYGSLPIKTSPLLTTGEFGLYLDGTLIVSPSGYTHLLWTLKGADGRSAWDRFARGLRRRTHARTGFCTHPPARWDRQRQVCFSCEHAMIELPELF